MLVASDRDVGFTVCGVSVGMDREQAKSTAQAYVSDLEEYEDMIAGQNGEEYFAAYYDENGIINYIMYFYVFRRQFQRHQCQRGSRNLVYRGAAARSMGLFWNRIRCPKSARKDIFLLSGARTFFCNG